MIHNWIEVIRFVGFIFSCVWVIEAFLGLVYYPYFFIPRFDKKHNIKQISDVSRLSKKLKIAALMWLSIASPGSRIYNNIVKKYAFDFYVSQYLKLPQEVLKTCRCMFYSAAIGVLSFAISVLLAYIISILESHGGY